MRNMIIKTAMMTKDVRGWEVAKYIFHIAEPTFYRKMREELPEDEQRKIAAQIEEYATRKGSRKNEQSASSF